MTFAGHALRFRVRDGRWTEDSSNALSPGRTRLVEAARGRVEVRHPNEAVLEALIEALDRSPDDTAAREVLRDWALENGRDALAEWLEEETQHHHGEADEAGFRDVAADVPVHLRARLARGPIAACGVEDCPARWEALPGTGAARTCGTCSHRVVFHDSDDVPPTEPHVLAPSLPQRIRFWDALLLGSLF